MKKERAEKLLSYYRTIEERPGDYERALAAAKKMEQEGRTGARLAKHIRAFIGAQKESSISLAKAEAIGVRLAAEVAIQKAEQQAIRE